MLWKPLFSVLVVFVAYYWVTRIKQGPVYESEKSLLGKTVVLTGGNAGIGKFTAIEIAKRKARVIIASRNVVKSEAAKQEIIELTGNDNIKVMKLDLENFDSIRKCAEEILSTEDHIDYLVNNAGVVYMDGMNKYGYGRVFTINHLGHFLLTNLLLDKMIKQSDERPVRIINVSSGAYKLGKLDWEHLHYDPVGMFDNFQVYSNSKLANVYFTSELANRLKSHQITSYAVHPGAIWSEIGDNMPFAAVVLFKSIALGFARDTIYGAQTIMYTMLDDDVIKFNGQYFADCSMEDLLPHATNQTVGRILWEKSTKMVGLDTTI